MLTRAQSNIAFAGKNNVQTLEEKLLHNQFVKAYPLFSLAASAKIYGMAAMALTDVAFF